MPAGILRPLPMRLALYLFATVLLGLVTSAGQAATALGIVILGEVIHLSSLTRERTAKFGEYVCSGDRRDVQRATAAIQAVCASIGVFLVWCATDNGETRFFGFVCVTTLIIHASITMPFFPWGSRLRLGVYTLVLSLLIFERYFNGRTLW